MWGQFLECDSALKTWANRTELPSGKPAIALERSPPPVPSSQLDYVCRDPNPDKITLQGLAVRTQHVSWESTVQRTTGGLAYRSCGVHSGTRTL